MEETVSREVHYSSESVVDLNKLNITSGWYCLCSGMSNQKWNLADSHGGSASSHNASLKCIRVHLWQ